MQQELIDISEMIMNLLKIVLNKHDEEWHIYTFKEDKDLPDPKRFRICRTRTFKVPIFGEHSTVDKIFAEVYFLEDEKVLSLKISKKLESILDKSSMEFTSGQDISGWKLEIN